MLPSIGREHYSALCHQWLPMLGDDESTMRFRVPKWLVNIAHYSKLYTRGNGPSRETEAIRVAVDAWSAKPYQSLRSHRCLQLAGDPAGRDRIHRVLGDRVCEAVVAFPALEGAELEGPPGRAQSPPVSCGLRISDIRAGGSEAAKVQGAYVVPA